MAKPRYAILLDGGFVKKKLLDQIGHHPTADDIVTKCEALQSLPEVVEHELLRIYYYDAYPAAQVLRQPVSRAPYNTSESERYRQSQSLFDQLVLKPNFALRMGQVGIAPTHWKLKGKVARELIRGPRPLTDDDFVVDAQQKGGRHADRHGHGPPGAEGNGATRRCRDGRFRLRPCVQVRTSRRGSSHSRLDGRERSRRAKAKQRHRIVAAQVAVFLWERA